MKNIQPWIIIGLAVVIALLIWFWPQTGTSDREKEISRWNQELQLKIDSISHRNRALIDSIKKDSVVYVQERNSFNAKIEAKNRELAQRRAQVVKSRTEVQALIDSVPKLQAFVQDMDSVVSSLDSLNTIKDHQLAAMEHMYNKLSVNVQGLTKNFEQRIALHAQQYENAKEIIALKDKELKKIKRANRWAKVGAVALGAVGLLAGSQM